jgi:antitoxin VapB
MALHISDPETERNVRALAAATGEPIAEAVNRAAIERLKSVEPRVDRATRMRRIRALLNEVDKLPILDHRSADEILGYDENGLPT